MRHLHVLALILSLVLLSCSNDSPVGSYPSMPSAPSPANQSAGEPPVLTLSWTGDGGIHYDVYLGTTSDPPRVAHELSVTHYRPDRLKVNTLYYWRVVNVGIDSEIGSHMWHFMTAPGTPPVGPVPHYPLNGAVLSLGGAAADSVTLRWGPQPGDSIVYNVYFGTSSNPKGVKSNLADTLYTVPVAAGKTYYWRVESKDIDALKTTTTLQHFQIQPIIGHMYNTAGTGIAGLGGLNQLPLATALKEPQDVAFDAAGNMVVVDSNNHRILGIVPETGAFKLLGGSTNGSAGDPCAPYPTPCDVIDPIGAKLDQPTSITVRDDGKMVLAAWHNHSVMLLDPAVSMSRIAGTGKSGYDPADTTANASKIDSPSASVYTAAGDLIFADQNNGILRRVDSAGKIHRFAGKAPVPSGTSYVAERGFSGDEGPALAATFNWETSTTCEKIAIDALGNIYVCDTLNHAIRRIDTAGIIHRFAGVYPASGGFSGDGGPATSAKLKKPRDIACDANGNVFIADTGNNVVRMVNPAGVISTVAGIPGVIGHSDSDGKLATESGLNYPYGIAIDTFGNLWIADTYNSRIRVVYR